MEAQSSGQRLVIVSAKRPAQAAVDVIVDIVQDCGWRLSAGGKSCISSGSDYLIASRVGPAGSQFLLWRQRGTRRCRACSIVPPHVPW